MLAKKLSAFLFVLCFIILRLASPAAADRKYTLTEDFLDGGSAELVDVNPVNDQLQLSVTETPHVFVNIAASGRGTIVRIDAETGDIIGEYRTAPQDLSASPSRTDVDGSGNIWTANQAESGLINGIPNGSVVKIGVVIGGTPHIKDPDPAPAAPEFIENESGEYLSGPFLYNTCVDRNEDGFIRTSRGLGNVLDWANNTDGEGGIDGIVQDAEDECILIYQRLPDAENPKHVSVDGSDNVWVGGYPDLFPGFPIFGGTPKLFHKLDGLTGDIIESESFDARDYGCGGFGGQIDENGILWSASKDQDQLLYYDPFNPEMSICIDVADSYGLGIDTNGFVWNSMGVNRQIAKVDPDPSILSIVGGFPKTTIPPDTPDKGVAVSPADNHVWLAKGLGTAVLRLDNDGNILEEVPLTDESGDQNGIDPTGITVDAYGKIWVTNKSSENVMRIDPGLVARDGDGNIVKEDGKDVILSPSKVDLAIHLLNSAPDNFSNMSAQVTLTTIPSMGTWTVIHDGGDTGTSWDLISWNTEPEGSEPEGTLITVEAQAADDSGDLNDDSNYVAVSNSEPLALAGRFIKIRVTLEGDDAGTSPVLSNLEIIKKVPVSTLCDVNGDGHIDIDDIRDIFSASGEEAAGADDPRDFNSDGLITVGDARGCVLNCTNPRCAPVGESM
jgi:streptogramin lyase